MIQTLRKRVKTEDQKGEEGFTLIELMVVVLIIAILLAIAIPTFLGARNRANDRAAQSSLRNALTAAKVIFTDAQNYQEATKTELEKEEPALTFVTTASTGPKVVSIESPPGATAQWTAAAYSKSGKCFRIKDDSSASGQGTTFKVTDPSTAAACVVEAATATGYTKDAWD